MKRRFIISLKLLGLLFETSILVPASGEGSLNDYRDKVRSQSLEDRNGLFLDATKVKVPSHCNEALAEISTTGDLNVLYDASFAIHRNGDPNACGLTTLTVPSLASSLEGINGCELTELDSYSIESFLTVLFTNELKTGECGSPDNATAPEGLVGFCDMGPARTVRQPDFEKLARLPKTGSLPCRFYTRDGFRINSLSSLAMVARSSLDGLHSCQEDEQECQSGHIVHLYAVPAGRMFMFAPSFVGEKFVVDHIPDAETIVVEVISLVPRVFELYDFFSLEEASNLIDEALSETSETHKLHRSTTGATEGKIYSKRTSDNAWVTHSALARKIKKRCLDFLGFDDFWQSHTDGLQVLRYQNGQAYVTHKDYLTNSANENYNYDSSGVGGNRYATVLLYMNDVDEDAGGETVFEKAWPVNISETQKLVPVRDTIKRLRESGQINLLKEGSWEEHLTAICRTRLAVKPRAGRAVLFYSQHPNGTVDDASLHGACPILSGTKWAANLWVFSAPRPEFDGAPRLRPEVPTKGTIAQKSAEFRNTGVDIRFDNAELFYDAQTSFGRLGPNDPPIRVNTYLDHRWHVMVDGKTLKEFVISKDEEQIFEI